MNKPVQLFGILAFVASLVVLVVTLGWVADALVWRWVLALCCLILISATMMVARGTLRINHDWSVEMEDRTVIVSNLDLFAGGVLVFLLALGSMRQGHFLQVASMMAVSAYFASHFRVRVAPAS